MENKKYKIAYIGLHPNTLVFLGNDPDFILAGACFLEYFFTFKTLNPINYIFKLAYYLRVKNKCRFLELFLIKIFELFSFMSSSVAYRFRDYLKTLSEKNILVFDEEKTDETEKFIKVNNVDLIVVNSWGMLSDKIIFAPKYKTINIHPSKLPQYRGALPTLWSLKNGDKESAVTYMILDGSMDGGGILSQHGFTILETDNSISLEKKIEVIFEKTLCIDIKKYLDRSILPSVQDMAMQSKTSKYSEYRRIDWAQEKAIDIFNKTILYPFVEPECYCFTFMENKKIEIKNAELYKNDDFSKIKPGEFIIKFPNFFIGARSGIIKCKLFFDVNFYNSLLILMKNTNKFN